MKSDEALWQEVDQALRRELGIAILQAAHAWCADLPVLGTHGAGPQARWRDGAMAASQRPLRRSRTCRFSLSHGNHDADAMPLARCPQAADGTSRSRTRRD